jgi:hypothetical protein
MDPNNDNKKVSTAIPEKIVSDDDGNGNLANNKVDTNIDPDTVGNYVYVSLCSCTLSVNCCIS